MFTPKIRNFVYFFIGLFAFAVWSGCSGNDDKSDKGAVEELSIRQKDLNLILEDYQKNAQKAHELNVLIEQPEIKERIQWRLRVDSLANERFEDLKTIENSILAMDRQIIDDYVKTMDAAYEWTRSIEFEKANNAEKQKIWKQFRNRFLTLNEHSARIRLKFGKWETDFKNFISPFVNK